MADEYIDVPQPDAQQPEQPESFDATESGDERPVKPWTKRDGVMYRRMQRADRPSSPRHQESDAKRYANKPRCKAKSTMAGGGQCRNFAVPGREVCRWHGGLSPAAGPSHPSYKHGLYSKALPTHLQEIAQQAAENADLLNMAPGIQLTDTRIVELLGKLENGAGRDAWRNMRIFLESLEAAMEDEDQHLIHQNLRQMRELIWSQLREHGIWEEVYQNLELRRKLVDTESKRREKAATVLSADQVLTFMHQVALILRRHVTDMQTLALIGSDLQALMHYSGDGSRAVVDAQGRAIPASSPGQ